MVKPFFEIRLLTPDFENCPVLKLAQNLVSERWPHVGEAQAVSVRKYSVVVYTPHHCHLRKETVSSRKYKHYQCLLSVKDASLSLHRSTETGNQQEVRVVHSITADRNRKGYDLERKNGNDDEGHVTHLQQAIVAG